MNDPTLEPTFEERRYAGAADRYQRALLQRFKAHAVHSEAARALLEAQNEEESAIEALDEAARILAKQR